MDWILGFYNYNVVIDYFPVFARGIKATLIIAGFSLVLSFFLGIFIALARMSSRAIIFYPATAYIQFIRSTPLLIQIYLVYYGLPLLFPIALDFSDNFTGIIVLTLNAAPYLGEIIRAGIESVGRGQSEGGIAVGMNRFQRMYYIVLPQALANITPPLLGQTAVLIKDTSLLSIIAVFEVTGAGMTLMSERIMPNEAFITLALCYLVIYLFMLVLSGMVQRKLGGTAWRTS